MVLVSSPLYFFFYMFFFFSSRRRHTRSKRDWSSDVCSSDLRLQRPATVALVHAQDVEACFEGLLRDSPHVGRLAGAFQTMNQHECRVLSPGPLPVTFREKPGSRFHLEKAFRNRRTGDRSQPASCHRRGDMGIAQQRMRLELLLRSVSCISNDALHTCFHLALRRFVPPPPASRRNCARQEQCQQPAVLVLAQHLEDYFIARPETSKLLAQLRVGLHALAVDFHNHVAFLEADV